MEANRVAPTTPITSRADRADERVRLIEEAVLLIRGEWPAVAGGLCESVNRASGLVFRSSELEEAIENASQEALRVVDRLYGHDATLEVQRLALAGGAPEPIATDRGAHHRPLRRLRSRSQRRAGAHAG